MHRFQEGHFIVGEGTTQTEIGPSRTQLTDSSNGTMNGNIEVSNTGEITTGLGGRNFVFGFGEGVIQTKDKSETADYSFIEVGALHRRGVDKFMESQHIAQIQGGIRHS
jgi:hypothetical protein